MTFFKLKKRQLTQFDRDLMMAREIVNTLGTTNVVHSWSIALAGGYYNERVYDGYGLKIVNSEHAGFYITFNKKIVLRLRYDSNYDSNIKEHIPGAWEEILLELYNKVPELSDIKEREKRLHNEKMNILNLLSQLPSCTISDFLRVDVKTSYYGVEQDYYDGTSYRVYYNDQLVFRGYNSAYNKKVDIYEPGEWIDQIRNYIDNLYNEQQVIEEEQNNKIAKEQIKRLRLIK